MKGLGVIKGTGFKEDLKAARAVLGHFPQLAPSEEKAPFRRKG